MKVRYRLFFGIFVTLGLLTACQSESPQDEIPQWKRFEVTLQDNSWEGDPFDVELIGKFTSPSGRTLEQFGFYAGENTWKIYFMPDEIGKWHFETQSEDPELNGKSGRFTCVQSNLEGQLTAEGNRWKLRDGGGDFPVIWNPPVRDSVQWGFRGRELSDPTVQETIQFSDEVIGARLLGFGAVLIAPIGWAKEWPQDAVPYVIGQEGDDFHFRFWDQLNAKLDEARERGMGAYLMLYSDDELTPDNFGITPQSKEELRFFKYVIARLAPYPHIMWDTGIDIGEYRDNGWIEWFVQWFKEHDPWKHPVGSRSGGGSGGLLPENAAYYSTGGAYLPSRADLLEFLNEDIPTAHTDHWRPFAERGDWTHRQIRIVHWRSALSGFQSIFPDYNKVTGRWEEVALGGQFIRNATRFFREYVQSDLLDINPNDELIESDENAILAANSGQEYIIYDEDGGEVEVNLRDANGTMTASWYDPREKGEYVGSMSVKGGEIVKFNAPDRDNDWVLHIYFEQ